MTDSNNNDFVNQTSTYVKEQSQGLLALFLGTLKKTFSFQGRATRKEFWTFVVATFIVNFILFLICGGLSAISHYIAIPFLGIIFLLDILLTISGISVSVRRLHDLNLTGFWLWYLSPIGLAIVFMVNLLDLDNSCNAVMNKVSKICTTWVSWLFLPLFWWFGAPVAQILLYLYKGKDEPNDFGPSPY